ncbi:hypothetical protein SK128_010723, partial [Halocaridina rubra]
AACGLLGYNAGTALSLLHRKSKISAAALIPKSHVSDSKRASNITVQHYDTCFQQLKYRRQGLKFADTMLYWYV